MSSLTRGASPAEDAVAQKCFRRLVWFVFVLNCVAFLDRINTGFAALSMNKELGLTATAFGFSFTVFAVGYLLCEIPSNLMMARFGARVWIARIMITWGIASAATMLAQGATSLYAIRLLVGIAEAGFYPGILLWLGYWFAGPYRARANALFMIAQPLTLAFASPLSGLLLEMNGTLGLSGWRWLFLLEGAPAVLLGIVAWFYLTDTPQQAAWLNAEEKAALAAQLAREHVTLPAHEGVRGVLRQLASRNVALLSVAYFGLIIALNTTALWTPLIMREWSGGASFAMMGLLAALPALAAVGAMLWWCARSDRARERTWHLVLPLLLAALGWIIVALAALPALKLAGLVCAACGSFSAMCIFWTLPASAAVLSPKARPAGIALINSMGVLGGAVGPVVIGYTRDLSGNFTLALLFVVAMLLLTALCASPVARKTEARKGRVGALA